MTGFPLGALLSRGAASECNSSPVNTSGDAIPSLAPDPEDPDLARVVAAWPLLPPHIRQTIATLITTMAPGLAPDATDAADVRLNAGRHRD
jgi:hypothetical protein